VPLRIIISWKWPNQQYNAIACQCANGKNGGCCEYRIAYCAKEELSMTLLITSTEQNKITIPAWLMATLNLHEGEEVSAIVEGDTLRVERIASMSPQNGKARADALSAGPDIDEAHDFPPLAEIVAQIKAMPPNPKSIHPATKSVQAVLAELAANPSPAPDYTWQEWDRMWAEFEAELKALDRADAAQAARLQVDLRRRGWQLGTVDALIATVALRYDLTLLTTDQDFSAIDGLKQENWMSSG
jgi:predicted nucleic acid-binding protein/antitoxin component of MazEF toxin-antitoxin module